MKLRNGVSPAAIELIKRFEGLRRRAAQLDDGHWTVGYSHTRSAREGAEVSEDDAEALLGYDLVDVQAAVNDWTFTPLTQNQFDALVSFVFNIGLDEFRHSAVLRRVNEGAMLQAACAMEMWRKADLDGERTVVDALIRRRAAEKALFLTPEEGFVATPSAVVRPKMDYDACAAVPRVRPTELRSDLEGATAAPVQTPLTDEDDSEPSPSERAAAAVSARLQAIWSEEHTPAVLELETPSVQPVDHEVSLAAEDEAPSIAATEDEPEETAPFLTVHTSGPAARFASTPASGRIAQMRSIFEQTRDDPEHVSFTPLAILGLIGVMLFVGGVFWALNAKPSSGPISVAGVGFVSGLIGIVCVAAAAYFLVDRLGADRS